MSSLSNSSGGESGLEEDRKMEIDDEIDSHQKLDHRKRELREIERFTDKTRRHTGDPQEKWQQELQDIEQSRNDLLPEHQKLQKRSHDFEKHVVSKRSDVH